MFNVECNRNYSSVTMNSLPLFIKTTSDMSFK